MKINDELKIGNEILKAYWSNNDKRFLKELATTYLGNQVNIRYGAGKTNNSSDSTFNIFIHSSINDCVWSRSSDLRTLRIGKNPHTKALIRFDRERRIYKIMLEEQLADTPHFYNIGYNNYIHFILSSDLKTVHIPTNIGKVYLYEYHDREEFKRCDKFTEGDREYLKFIFANIPEFIAKIKRFKELKEQRLKRTLKMILKMPFIDRMIEIEPKKEPSMRELKYTFFNFKNNTEPLYIFITKPLTAQLPELKNGKHKTAKIGRYAILINKNSFVVETILSLDKNILFVFQHPHISGTGVCWGDYAPLMRRATREGNIIMMLSYIHKFLTRLTGHSEYISYSKFIRFFQKPAIEVIKINTNYTSFYGITCSEELEDLLNMSEEEVFKKYHR